jgi:flagellar biosynthesis activator protein FlaF
MSNSSHAIQAYRTASRYRSQRDQEADVFRQAIAGLRGARNATAIHQIRALADNRRLWSTVTDLMRDPSNALPEPLRASIVSVGLSVQREMDQDTPDFDS